MFRHYGAKESGSCEKSLSSSQLDAFLEGKVETANLTSDAHKWQAVIKSGEHETRHVQRRCEKCLSCSRPDLVAFGTSFWFTFSQ